MEGVDYTALPKLFTATIVELPFNFPIFVLFIIFC